MSDQIIYQLSYDIYDPKEYSAPYPIYDFTDLSLALMQAYALICKHPYIPWFKREYTISSHFSHLNIPTLPIWSATREDMEYTLWISPAILNPTNCLQFFDNVCARHFK